VKVSSRKALGHGLLDFYRAAECRRGLAMRILSVCPSVKRVNCDEMEERCVRIFILYERAFNLVFLEEK